MAIYLYEHVWFMHKNWHEPNLVPVILSLHNHCMNHFWFMRLMYSPDQSIFGILQNKPAQNSRTTGHTKSLTVQENGKPGLNGQLRIFCKLARSLQDNGKDILTLWSHCNFHVVVHSCKTGSFMGKPARLHDDF